MEQDPEDGWWVGLVEELPGCGSQGSTLEECREMVADAIHEYLIARGDVPAHAEEATY
ncbi:MAG: type II toxin-antitoxin system HicB family antitoxin [Armatimonadetes bacterium]|nr:type II toxin-antitoxin system HicB family antitoxin [Armatimonadota bacterium]